MMIEFRRGDILAADAEALVNTVNCVGVMGRGIALQFKNAFPSNFKAYAAACKRDEVVPGRMFVFDTGRVRPRYIINFPTKRHWRGKSRMSDIEAGLGALVEEIARREIRSIAIPPLGAGLGGLDWLKVRDRIEEALRALPHTEVIVYEPAGAPDAERIARSPERPSMAAGRAALLSLMRRYLSGFMDTTVTLLELHKLMYFMQEAGHPLRLEFKKSYYGPYAQNLGPVLRLLEGHFISGYADGGDDPEKQLELLPGAADEAEAFLRNDHDTRSRFDRVARLVDGFESPFGLELLASVHWLAVHEKALSLQDVTARVYSWNQRKRKFLPEQIELAWNVLRMQGWISVQPALP